MPNVIAPNPDMEGATGILAIIEKFDIQKSAERMRPKVAKFRTLTVEIVRELYFVKEFLKRQSGQHKDPDADDYISYTWQDYCRDIDLPRQFANAKVRRFTPRELSEDNKDHLLDDDVKKLALPEPPLTGREAEQRIAQAMATGERPGGWTKAEEKILEQRVENEEFKKIKDIWMGEKFSRKSNIDYFAEVTNLTRGVKRFNLKTQDQTNAQLVMFRAINRYLGLFGDRATLMSAARNLTEKIHSVANYFAESLANDEEEAAP
jgi:hypothetical protein